MISLIAGRLLSGPPEIPSVYEGDVAFEFRLVGSVGLSLHQRKCAGIFFDWSGHAGFGNDEWEIGCAKVFADVMDEI